MTDEKKPLPPPPSPVQDMIDELKAQSAFTEKGPQTMEEISKDIDAMFDAHSTEDSRADNPYYAPKMPSISYGPGVVKDTSLRDKAAAERTERPIVSEPSEGKVTGDKRIVCWVETKVPGDHSAWVIRKAVGEWKRGAGDAWGVDYPTPEEAAKEGLKMSRKYGYKYVGIADWV